MGHKISTPLQEGVANIHTELMQQAGADYDIGTATTLTYPTLLSYIKELNEVCSRFKDHSDCILHFNIKPGTVSTIPLLWKATVKINCNKHNLSKNSNESTRCLNLRQFLQVYRRIIYHYSQNTPEVEVATEAVSSLQPNVFPTTVASSVFNDRLEPETDNVEECIICLERKPEVILPCVHAYCLPCIEQWWEYSEVGFEEFCIFASEMNVRGKNCPVCRDVLTSTDDTWVLSEAPSDKEVRDDAEKNLFCLATERK